MNERALKQRNFSLKKANINSLKQSFSVFIRSLQLQTDQMSFLGKVDLVCLRSILSTAGTQSGMKRGRAMASFRLQDWIRKLACLPAFLVDLTELTGQKYGGREGLRLFKKFTAQVRREIAQAKAEAMLAGEVVQFTTKSGKFITEAEAMSALVIERVSLELWERMQFRARIAGQAIAFAKPAQGNVKRRTKAKRVKQPAKVAPLKIKRRIERDDQGNDHMVVTAQSA